MHLYFSTKKKPSAIRASQHSCSNFNLDSLEHSEDEPNILTDGKLFAKDLVDLDQLKRHREKAKEMRQSLLEQVPVPQKGGRQVHATPTAGEPSLGELYFLHYFTSLSLN